MASGEILPGLQPIKASDDPHILNFWNRDDGPKGYRVEVSHNSECCTPPSDCQNKVIVAFVSETLATKRAFCECGQEVDVSIAAVRVLLGRGKLHKRLGIQP